MRKGGFTLVELLIVMALIAMLAAMLLPVLSRAREVARKTSCKHNLHQLATAARAYAEDDFGEFFPVDDLELVPDPVASHRIQQGSGGPRRIRHGLLYDPDGDLNYVGGPHIFVCPSSALSISERDFTIARDVDASYWWLNGDHPDANTLGPANLDGLTEYPRFPFFWDRFGNHRAETNVVFPDAHTEWVRGSVGRSATSPDKIRSMILQILQAPRKLR